MTFKEKKERFQFNGINHKLCSFVRIKKKKFQFIVDFTFLKKS